MGLRNILLKCLENQKEIKSGFTGIKDDKHNFVHKTLNFKY